MSRLDPRDGQQGAAAGDYLRRGDVGEEERFAFLRLFPNQNGSLGDSLISEPATQTPAFSSALERDRAALELIREWLADPGYAALRGELLRSEARLAGFVAGGAGAASASSPAKTP
jgi:hypothetical protein